MKNRARVPDVMTSSRHAVIAILSTLYCVSAISCAWPRTHEVGSFVTLHEGVRLSNARRADSLITVDEVIETATAFTDETLSLRPRIGGYEISVRIDSRPGMGQDSQYKELNAHGLKNSFLVMRGSPPLKPVVLESKYAEIRRLEVSADIRSRLEELRSGKAEISEILAIRYVIGWNEHRLEGRAYIARTTHREPDPLLD